MSDSEDRIPMERQQGDITILDRNDNAAVASIVASHGIDYLEEAKFDGEGKIIGVPWERKPPGDGRNGEWPAAGLLVFGFEPSSEPRSNGEEIMIARIWQGRTRPGMGKPYLAYLEQTGLKGYKATEGCRDVLVLTREMGEVTEYVLITLWESMDAVRRFAGPQPERAVYYPEDDRYFPEEERTPFVRHYEVRGAD